MWLALVLLVALAGDTVSKDAPDFQSFVTEPKFKVVTIHKLQDSAPKKLAPGHIFLSPYRGFEGYGPQIFDSDGELVWFGGDTVEKRAIDLQPCLFNSSSYDHLCYNDAFPVEQNGHSTGVIRLFDNTYTQVGKDYKAINGLRGPDIHELNTPTSQHGKTLLQDIYQVRGMDLSDYGGPEDGFVLDGCFQEIDLVTHDVVFQWCSVDHVDLDTTFVYLPDSGKYFIPGIAGNGRREAPWDWFHINAIDRNDAGDYVISSRHCNAIFHIAGANNQQGHKPGDVIWRLGGKRNDFTMEGNLNFSAQHTIRYQQVDGPHHMIVSLFNNAFEGQTHTADASSGQLIDLDIKKMRASLISQYFHPSRLVAQDQGGVQMLPNGNAFIGWGHCNFYTEHAHSGETLLNVQFGGKGDCEQGDGDDTFFVSSFRAWRYPWKGYPKTSPKVLGYAQTCSSRIHFYASWNGATEVSKWAFYATNRTSDVGVPSAYRHVATVPKSGFETKTELGFAKYFFVQPLDSKGKPFDASVFATAFVPKPELHCRERRCRDVAQHVKKNSMVETCAVTFPPLREPVFGERWLGPVIPRVIVLAVLCAALEASVESFSRYAYLNIRGI